MRRIGSAGLSIGQLFVIIFGFLITSALIFLFGIWVGRDIAERRLVQEERVVRQPIPVQPTAAKEAGGTGEVDLAFFQKIKERAAERLQQTAAAEATPTRPAPLPSPMRMAADKPTPRATPRLPTPAIFGNPGNAKAPAAAATDEWADAGWTVQVNATTNPQQATDLAQHLRTKGFDAYTVQAPMRGQTWYRVRVGRFKTHDKAKEMEERLKTSEGLQNAYVTPQ